MSLMVSHLKKGHIMRRFLAMIGMIGLLLGLSLGGCARAPQSPSGGSGRVTLGMSYIPDIQFAPFYVAESNGLFTQAGVDAQLRHHGSNEGLFTALLAGEEDYVLAGGDEVVQARSEGMDVVAIGQYYRTYPITIIVPENSDIHSAADLAGRSIGVPGRFGESWFGLLVALSQAGLSQSDVSIVEIGYTQRAALTTGRVEAIIGFSNNDQVQFAAAGIPTRTVPLTASGTVPLQSTVLVTTSQRLATHQDEAKRVVAGMTEGIRATIAAPASAVTAAQKFIPTLADQGGESAASATLKATIPLWTHPDGTVSADMDEEAWVAMCSFMLQQGIITSAVEAKDAMNNTATTP